MNLNDLMMTHEELEEEDFPKKAAGVADRAVAKALWGLVDYAREFREDHPDSARTEGYRDLEIILGSKLASAGIQRPGGKNADD